MDGFNSREFYGYSLSEDPKLRTTTRNYEFKYNSSDHLERIISRVRMDREKKKEMEQLPHNNGHVRFHNRFPKTTNVETQIGSSRSREAVVKIMSDEEIDAMISQALSPNNSPVLAETNSLKDVMPTKEIKPTELIEKDEKLPKLSVEYVPNLQPQWVEIKPVQKSIASLFEVPVDAFHADDSSDSEYLLASNFSKYKELEKENEELEIDETLNVNRYFESLSPDSMMSEDFVMRNQESEFQNDDNVDEESPPESLNSLGIESSLNECEHLEMERVFEKILPLVPKIQFESLECQEISENSEYSDEEDEKEETITQDDLSFEEDELDIQSQQEVNVHKIDLASRPNQSLSIRSAKSSPTKTSRSVKKTPKLRKVAKTLPSNRNSPKASTAEARLNIQIEDLKREKLRIFSKMTSIQEKISKSLDALRISLVEISLPDGDVEKKLRERNGLEFSVRFSRNYLFPLGKMIDDLRLSPKEDYRSALTNEPCVKVCGIYGLLSQAVQCYQKQLRHFFTDSFPKKLDLLLNLIRDTTNICLEKQIFDKRDTLIQSLLYRCETFLEFVLNFAEKKKSARNEEISLQSERKSQFKLPKTSSKWDLTMNLNSLNMYEPKLVKKKTKKAPQTKTVKANSQRCTPKTKKKKLIPRDSADHVALPIDDPVETQVRKDNHIVDSVQLINDAIAEEPESELTKAVIETLQDITKDEVHQMFGPIVLNLDSILKSSDNPQIAVESVLNALKSKLQEAKDKQHKIDERTTENNTQNMNSYQKEVTKKGTHSSIGKQQKQQQFEETRQNKVSKAKAKVASCSSKNVKEDSTEQTKRYSRSQLTDTNTICDKQSLSNIDVVAAFVSENGSMNQKTHSGAFLSATAATAKKPTPASDTNEVGGIAAAAPPPSTPVNNLPAKLDDVMPPPPLSRNVVTSEQCLNYSTALPVGLPRADKFISEFNEIIGDGKHVKEDATSQQNVRDGAANAIDRGATDDNQEAWRKNLPAASSPVRNEATKSGEMKKLYYRNNALYTFVTYLENSLPSQNEQDVTENLNENPNNIVVSEEIEAQKRDTIVKPADLLKSSIESKLEQVVDISSEKQPNEEHQIDIDIKALLEERNDFIERCKDDPFYTNPQFPQPWKVLSKISKVIAREIIENFENDLSFGEESYIRDFIDMEVQT